MSDYVRTLKDNTKYKQEYCKSLVEHMAQGLSFEAFGGVILVGRRTLYDWIERHEEFEYAYEVGKSICRLWWEQNGVDNLVMTDGIKFNASMWIFNMKARFGWRDEDKKEAEKTSGAADKIVENMIKEGKIKFE